MMADHSRLSYATRTVKLTTYVVGVAVVLLVLWSTFRRQSFSLVPLITGAIQSSDYSYVGDDFPRKWDIPLDDVYMSVENSAHLSFNDTSAALNWGHMLPSNGGTIFLGKPDEPQQFTISLFHQMRCLDIIRRSLVAFRDPIPQNRKQPDRLTHHCMNYLRQMVLCRSITDIESVRASTGPRVAVSEKTHTCKDWSSVYEAAEANTKQYSARD